MINDERNLQQEDAVRDPLLMAQSETAGAVEPLATSDEPSAPSPGGNGGVSENSALGAFRRVRLNPTVDDSQFRAVPSLQPAMGDGADRSSVAVETAPKNRAGEDGQAGPQSAPNAGSGSAVADAPHVGQSPAPHAERSSAPPVEIPPPVKNLDAEMEAEIEAALASGDLDLAGSDSSEHVSPAIVEDEAADAEKPPEEQLEAGQHLTGRIQAIHKDSVFLDLGYRSPGVVAMRQFVSGKKPEVGQRIEVLVDRVAHDEGLIHLNLPRGIRRIAGNWEALSKGQIVDCIVNRTNKGGLEVTVSGLRAFLPSSQIEMGFVSDLAPYVGQKVRAEVIEVNKKKRNLVVSRRAYLLIERKEAEEKLWETLAVEQTFTGCVKTIKDYGAFVDLGGGVDGFLHIGEMSWHRIKHPSEVVKEGQTVDVKVLSLDREKKKISLGMKQLVQNPWSTAAERFSANSTVTGKVTRIADFGAFVELEPGLEGLVHVSELDHKRVRHPSDVLKVHQVVTAQVLEVDAERKRISLSLKALLARPEEPKREEEPTPEPIARKRKGPLKGGTGGKAPGGLFGNPADFT